MSDPSNQTAPAVGSISRNTSRAVVLLPQPLFPHQRQRLAWEQLERQAVDGADVTHGARHQQAATHRIVLG